MMNRLRPDLVARVFPSSWVVSGASSPMAHVSRPSCRPRLLHQGSQASRRPSKAGRPLAQQPVRACRFSSASVQSASGSRVSWNSVNNNNHNIGHNSRQIHTQSRVEVLPIADREYHELSDGYLNTLYDKMEELQEADERYDVEFSSGVITFSAHDKGTYVINKQPPNKQIWLSSPISGPKRYDWVQIDGGPRRDWVYARDQSSLSELLAAELDIAMPPGDAL